jgi:hypothetical protein
MHFNVSALFLNVFGFYMANFKNKDLKDSGTGDNMPGTKNCGKCGVKTPIGDMTYSVDGTKLVCQTCLNKEKGIYTASGVPPAPKPAAPKPEMANYHCGHCKYSFSRKKDIEVKTCPYCSNEL